MTEIKDMPSQTDAEKIHEVQKYVETNLVDLTNERQCVDGRENKYNWGRLSRPGADGGYIEALLLAKKVLGLNLSVEECFDKVFKALKTINDISKIKTEYILYLHTDDHGSGFGCGHMVKAVNPDFCDNYGLPAEEMTEVIKLAQNKKAEGENIEIDVLHGHHHEEGVLIINSQDKTVKHQADNKQFFVYDAKADEEFMRQLVDQMAIPSLGFEDFKKASDQQTQATLHILAQGKNIYQVNFENNQPKVSFVGKVD